MMEFEEVERKTDFGLAVVICQKSLSPGFFDKLLFIEWLDVYDKAPHGHQLRKTAFDKMLEIAYSPDEWVRIYTRIRPNNDLTKTILAEIDKAEAPFEQWLKIYNEASVDGDNDLKKIAVAKMSKLATG